MKNILILNGPNLNLLGTREPERYGTLSLTALNDALQAHAYAANVVINTLQSNHEGTLIEAIHRAPADKIAYIIINPAAFTHTSIALRDALLAVNIPFIEVHLSNIYAREPFRQQSYFSDIATAVITGFGTQGYFYALQFIIETLLA